METSGMKPRLDERGVSMVEFVIVFPLFMLLTILIIDFGRASALRAVVDEAVSRSLTRAVVVPNLDVDLPASGPDQVAATDGDFLNLQYARSLVANDGISFLSGVGLLHVNSDVDQAGAQGSKLFDVVHSENRVIGGPVDLPLKLMVLRPGECAVVPSVGITECNRETLGLTPADPMPEENAHRSRVLD